MDYVVKDMPDQRGISDIGAALFVKRGGDAKYHLWLPLTNIPATGAAPESLDTTVTTSRRITHTPGRIDPGDKTCTFMAHRDNFEILRKDNRKRLDFLQVNPDGTGWKFQGTVTYFQDEVSVGSNLTGSATITVSSSDEDPIIDVTDIIQETVTFVSAIDGYVEVEVGKNVTFNVECDPANATITAESATDSVATAQVAAGILTITGAKAGSSIVKVKATHEGCADGLTHVLVKVK